jgi:hypothetical protein
VRRVECLQHLSVVEDLPQGVRARFLSEGLEVVEKLRRNRPLNSRRVSAGKLPWKV